MAVQMGIIPLLGTIGNLNFYKSGDRYLARAKTGVTADRIAIDPKFERSRENAAEFAAAAKAGKLMRKAFQMLVQPNRDTTMVRRLTSKMILVLQGDSKGKRGMRKVVDGKPSLLEGFEFHEHANLSNTFFAPYTSDIDRGTGELKISIPPFVPVDLVTPPPSATHFKLMSGGAALDFENNSHVADIHKSVELTLNNEETTEIVFIHKVPANSTHHLFLVLGLQFFQQVNEWMYPLNDGSFNALAIIKASVS